MQETIKRQLDVTDLYRTHPNIVIPLYGRHVNEISNAKRNESAADFSLRRHIFVTNLCCCYFHLLGKTHTQFTHRLVYF